MDDFQLAAERAYRRYSHAEWGSFTAKERSGAIYRELKLIDEENARSHQPGGSQSDYFPADASEPN